ncbi:MAG: IdeS/Mac family cysteine endopeptidase [Akkermansia sp.]|nr:IdeS/Mac family cysteine endopeptidase [Akkermansia sp.]
MKTRLTGLLLCCCASIGTAGEVWTQGVNAETGWYDVNKDFDGVDDELCWAASSSNILAWWQDRNAELALASGAPQGCDAIWSTFVQSFGNLDRDAGGDYGGYETDAFHWYLDGTIDEDWYHISEYGRTQGGYYRELVSTAGGIDYFWASGAWADGAAMGAAIVDALTSGCGVTLGICSPTFSHSLTLWGVVCNDSGDITRMYLTDSDDGRVGQHGLFSVTCEAKDMLVEVWEGFSTELNVLHIESEDVLPGGGKYLGEDVYISDFSWIQSTMPRIPEPSPAALVLPALAALSIRRRRNR